MPVSYDSLTYHPTATKRKIYVRKQYLNKPHYAPLDGITDLEKMIAQPAKQTLNKRLSECLKRLRKSQVAVTTTHHVSPRSRRRSRRRSRPRSRRRGRPRSRRRSPSRRSRRRSPRHYKSRKRY
jgi:hypothetical protein